MKLLLIDNYDSFTYNVYQYLMELGHNVLVFRNDKITIENIKDINPDAIFLSPGPGTPSEAGVCIPAIKEFAGKISIFGICLGHQAIGEAFGGVIKHAKQLMHGKISSIKPCNKGVMKEFDSEFIATRYHSLVIEKDTIPDCLEITCESHDGEIMGVIHKKYNIEGVQFHPESILTVEGKKMLKSFLDRTALLLETCDECSPNIPQESIFKTGINDFNPDEFITVNQYATIIDIHEDIYKVFKRMTNVIGSDQCFLLESAAGPQIDCVRTLIGVYPALEIKLDKAKLEIQSHNKYLNLKLNSILSKEYSKEGEAYDLKTDKFSRVFDIFTKSIQLETMHNLDLNISNGLVGYFSYEYLHYLENVQRKPLNVLGLPDVHLKYFPVLIQVDYSSRQAVIIENRVNNEPILQIEDLISIISEHESESDADMKLEKEIPSSKLKDNFDFDSLEPKSNISKEDYFKNVNKAKHHIYEGNIFQVQLGQRVTVKKDINSLALYDKLREINPSPYMFFWDSTDYQLIGDSPELQLRVEGNEVMIRPIAGTSKGKGVDAESRREIIEKFRNDSKENAEHIMLVDLARNDIGRMAAPGTVEVTQLMNVEEFSHVFHLISTVVGNLKEKVNSMEIFEATFPAGTLTGAPKVKAMEIIADLEPEVRGPYGGAFGFFDFNGNIVSSIIIRTVLKMGEKLFLQASAGIVADSTAEEEWQETSFKMKALMHAIEEVK